MRTGYISRLSAQELILLFFVISRLTDSCRAFTKSEMPENDPSPSPLINLKKYAELMDVTRQAVRYQLDKGICAVPPIAGTKPPKWRLDDVESYKRRVGVL